MSQHAELTPERWLRFTLPQRLLQIAVEMNRAAKFIPRDDALAIVRASYERVLRLVDLTVELETERHRRRELLRWREAVGELYLHSQPDAAAHRLATRVLLQLHPDTIAQVAYLP